MTIQQLVTTPVDSGLGTDGNVGGDIINANFNYLNRLTSAYTLPASQQPNIDPTGVRDSAAGFQTALNLAASTNVTLIVDCPIFLSIGMSATKIIFWPSNVTVEFVGNGMLLVDNLGVVAFEFLNVQAVTFINCHVRYIAGTFPSTVPSFGVAGIDYINPGVFQNTIQATISALKFNSAAKTGIVYTGVGTYFNQSNLAMCSIFHIVGSSSNINFFGTTIIDVPAGLTADCFIPSALMFQAMWKPGQAVNNTYQIVGTNSTTMNAPDQIYFDNLTIDGCLMGMQSAAGTNIRVGYLVGKRYSDLQDKSGGNNNVGGIKAWYPPPHLVYMDQATDPTLLFSAFIESGLDFGLYVGTAATRYSGSGIISSIKMGLCNGTYVHNFKSQRPHGGFEIVPSGLNNGGDQITGESVLNTAVTSYNVLTFATPPTLSVATLLDAWVFPTGTSVVTFSDAQTKTVSFTQYSTACSWTGDLTGTPTVLATFVTPNTGALGLSFNGNQPFANLDINLSITDTALIPTGWPVAGSAQYNQNCNITINTTVQDWPGSYQPGFPFSGDQSKVRRTTRFIACTSTTISTGTCANFGGTAFTTNSDIEDIVIGWRTIPVIFSAAPTSTSTTLLNNWTYTSGAFRTIFSDGQERLVTFTNGANTATWSPALTGTPTATATCQGINLANFENAKQRVLIQGGASGTTYGKCYNNYVRMLDVSNEYEVLSRGGIPIEYLNQSQVIVPPSGASMITDVTVPQSFDVIASHFYTQATYGTTGSLTTISMVLTPGGTNCSFTNGSPSITVSTAPVFFAVGNAIVFATTVGTGGGQFLAGTTYYVVLVTATTIQASATLGGVAITVNGSANINGAPIPVTLLSACSHTAGFINPQKNPRPYPVQGGGALSVVADSGTFDGVTGVSIAGVRSQRIGGIAG